MIFTATSKDLTKEERIAKEIRKLRSLLKNLPAEKSKTAEGLVRRIAFMQVTLEDLEADINANGTVERFSQTEDIEYDRERPAVRIYNATIRNYTTACKQLIDLLPEGKPKDEADKLMEFVKRAAKK